MSAPNVTEKSTSTERIRTMDPQFECLSVQPTELIGKFPLATASRSTVYQHCYINKTPTTILWNELVYVQDNYN